MFLRSVPHVTNAIQDWIEKIAQIPVNGSQERPDICVIELGNYIAHNLGPDSSLHVKVVLWETSKALHLSML
jgi:hypothetical protein